MRSSVVRGGCIVFVALLVFASCAKGKNEADKTKARSAVKTATATAGSGSAPKKSALQRTNGTETGSADNSYKLNIKTNSKTADYDINAIAPSH